MVAKVVGLFFKHDRKSCARIANMIEEAGCWDPEIEFLSGEPGDGSFCPALSEKMRGLEFAVSIGGDGAFLRTARALRGLGVPLYGINAGRLGFLASGKPEDAISDVARILSGDYGVFSRAALRCSIEGRVGEEFFALNEITLSKGPAQRPIDLSVKAGGEALYRFLADGVIVSTPTGSTAYSLSAGGPVVHPNVRCLLVTPICPHSLYPRPIALGEDEIIEVRLEGESDGTTISGDGLLNVPTARGDTVRIWLDKKGASVITIGRSSYYEVLRKKLNWGVGNGSIGPARDND
ncbi:MAG: NAD(+)/NADH kinase [Synergistaceae bacterium]|jgi:NAD+ kinase|nr:NAD(+)/NADH kinase [Synergistaceae bacterium]